MRGYLLFFALALALGCKEVEDPFQLPPASGDALFYPLQPGKFWEYEVDSIVFDQNADVPIDTVRLLWREEVTDTFLDLQNHPWYRIECFEKREDSLPWTLRQVVAATIRGNEALRLENDLTFVKLHFPLTPFKDWNGNKYFDPGTVVYVSGEPLQMFTNWEYQVQELLPGQVAILQADSDNLLERRYSLERYSLDTGLVQRELQILDTQLIDEEIPWPQKAQRGFILKQTLVRTN